MDTAGKAVLFSGLTVLISLSAVMLVPSPAFRSMALGIMLAVVFVLAATLTLLPAVLARLGDRVDALSLPWVHAGEHRSARFAAWAERLWQRPARVRRRRPGRPRRARRAGPRPAHRHAQHQGRPRGRRPAASATASSPTPSAPAPPARCRSSPPRRRPPQPPRSLTADPADRPGRCRPMPGSGDRVLLQAVPTSTRPTRRWATPSTGCAPTSRPRPWSVAPPPRTTTSSRCSRTAPRW